MNSPLLFTVISDYSQYYVLFGSLIATFYVLYYLILLYDSSFSYHERYLPGKTALLVTAHPDDECMFFGPSVVNLIKNGCSVYILCLSPGNYDKLGHKRKDELRQSCKCLGIPMGNVIIIQHSKLPDDPNVMWNKTVVGNLILKYVEALSANLVLSFDKYGVSGHPNHISIYRGLMYLLKEQSLPKDSKVYLLETVNIIRKYSSFLDMPVSYIAGYLAFVSSFNEVRITQKAMRAHRTQYVWFRKLYIIFSRYVYINTFKLLS